MLGKLAAVILYRFSIYLKEPLAFPASQLPLIFMIIIIINVKHIENRSTITIGHSGIKERVNMVIQG